MFKTVLLLFTLFLSAPVGASTITCQFGARTVKDILAEQEGIASPMSFPSFGSATLDLIGDSDRKYTIEVDSHKDEFVDVTNVLLRFYEGQKLLARKNFMLKYHGQVEGGSKELGEEGDDKLVPIDNSTEATFVTGIVNRELLPILKNHRLYRSVVYNNTQSIDASVRDAVEAGDLEANDRLVYFIFNLFNCYRK